MGEVGSVKQQLGSTEEKVTQLTKTNASLEAALVAKSDEAQKAKVELANLKIVNDKAQSAADSSSADIEAELVTTKQKLTEKERETTRLLEENERLSEQLASSVERPAADGEEAGNGEMNGHGEAAHDGPAQKEVTKDWRDKFEVLHMEHEKMLAKQKMLQIEFETEVSKYQGELEGIKSKNNDLNTSLANAKKASTALLVRLFPTIPPNVEPEKLEQLAKEALKDLQAEKSVSAPDNSEEEEERLSKELSEERKKKEELSSKVDDLVTTNTTLQQLVGTTQEALDKENTMVKSIQEQVTNNKEELLANQNGPSNSKGIIGKSLTATSTPSIASIDSTTNTTPEKKKKSKKKKLLGLFKSS